MKDGLGAIFVLQNFGEIFLGRWEGLAVKPSGKNWQSILCQWEGLAAKLSGNIVKYVWANGKAWQPNFGAKVLTKVLLGQWESLAAKFLGQIFATYLWASGKAWQQSFQQNVGKVFLGQW